MPEVFTDYSDQPLLLVRAEPDGALATGLGVSLGRAARDGSGVLVVRTAPDSWLLIAPAEPTAPLASRVAALTDGEFVTTVDVTHGHTLVRLAGVAAAPVLSRLCAIDLADAATPNGAAFRSIVAGIRATVIRDDADGERSYLVHCDRSYGQYLKDVLSDTGRIFLAGQGRHC